MIDTILILISHWFADFVFQDSWMAENKHKDLSALHSHVSIYSLVLFICLTNPLSYFHYNIQYLIYFVLLNAVLHGFVDFFTSKLAHKFWASQNYRLFFVTLGFDQLLHQICLITTAGIFSQWTIR